MKFTKNWKRFWTLNRHHAEGFTLVELIVVIAILAILAGVAVPAYSGYITKTNMTADQTLVSEVEHALILQYYSDPANATSAYVVLSTSGATADSEDGFAAAAMQAAFGENWQEVTVLKYNGWNGSYPDSNFAGHEEELVEKVDVLTSTLGDAIKENAGDKFTKFMTDNGISEENAGQAAVLYVAQNTANMTTEQQQAFVDSLSNAISGSDSDLIGAVNAGSFGGTDAVSSIAAVYAFAEAYAKYDPNVSATLDTSSITDVESAGAAVQKFFGEIVNEADEDKLKAYFADGHATADAEAYLDLMGTVNGAKDVVISNGLENGFSSMSDIFTGYQKGNVYVYLLVDGSEISTQILPEILPGE